MWMEFYLLLIELIKELENFLSLFLVLKNINNILYTLALFYKYCSELHAKLRDGNI